MESLRLYKVERRRMKLKCRKKGWVGGRIDQSQRTQAKDLRKKPNFSKLFQISLTSSLSSTCICNLLFVRTLQLSPTTPEKLASHFKSDSHSALVEASNRDKVLLLLRS